MCVCVCLSQVYLPCVLQTKKRYVGYMYESLDQKEPTFDAKGIETVRRDGCPAVSKVTSKPFSSLPHFSVLYTNHCHASFLPPLVYSDLFTRVSQGKGLWLLREMLVLCLDTEMSQCLILPFRLSHTHI